ncbi:hypothetical protein [Frankia sp. R82]|uniref:hypothetical protein n=1 Tax=Frankia sp. R82 TaxID=2950553 RepID=UPI0020430A8A|nr:hypothetical protein [Frankia sp. R82]MCM3886835.1 hypothetical protein [Frankia sp. R82]
MAATQHSRTARRTPAVREDRAPQRVAGAAQLAPNARRKALLDILPRYFPLVPRPKPACGSLTERLDRLHHKANLARSDDNPLVHAAEALNLAALIASDCAMPQLARDLCWRQIYRFTTGPGPYDHTTATLALQPLINLARLHTRQGDGTTAYHLHEALLRAAHTRSDLRIDGHTIPLDALVTYGEDHAKIVQWLWTILLGSGLRALCQTGQWTDAYHQALQHRGIGCRLLDGRQIAILHHATTSQSAEATSILDHSDTPDQWEHAVTAHLQFITHVLTGDRTDDGAADMADAHLTVTSAPEPVPGAFHLRLWLITTELLHITGQSSRVGIAMSDQLLDAALRDAYLARDVVTARADTALTDASRSQLHTTLLRSNLGTPLTAENLDRLLKAARQSETALAIQLRRR